MKKQVLIISVLILGFMSVKMVAQKKINQLNEVVVTATKFKLKKEHTGKVIYKITQQEIKNNASKSVLDLLNNIPGIEIKGTNSNAAGPKSIFMRGSRNRQVVILIDGIPVSDASGIGQEYDLRLLSLNQIESIEVLKGASSTLYGSGASTGVISITLKKGSKNEISGTYEASSGTNNSANSSSTFLSDANQNASINGTLGKINYLAYFNLTDKKGLSAAKSKTNKIFEKDPLYKKNGLLKLGYQITKRFKAATFFNYDAFRYKYDMGAYKDNLINKGEYEQIRYGIKPSFIYTKGEVFAIASLNKITRNFLSQSFGKINKFNYEGTSINIDLANKYAFNTNFQLIMGLNYQKHENQTNTDFSTIDKKKANFNTIDPYASAVYTSNFGLNINLGGRLNIHSKYGNHFVYDANVSHNILQKKDASVKLLASYSSAFIAPSLYQLYSSSGNLNLQPESSTTLEFGFESSYKNWLHINAVYFQRETKDAIIYKSLTVAPWGLYDNAKQKENVKGVETDVVLRPIDKLKLQIGYTYTKKDVDLDYIPKHKLVATLETNPFKNTFMSFVFKSVGERTLFDKYGSYGTAKTNIVLPKYNLLDFNANYKLLNGKVTFFGSVTNLLNEDYDDILGYTTRGRNYKIGIRIQL